MSRLEPFTTFPTSNRMLAQLEAREAGACPIRVAVIGTGDYGETLVAQLLQIRGLRPSIVCDLDLERAARAYAMGGLAQADVVRATRLAQIEQCVADDRPAITDDLELREWWILDTSIKLMYNVASSLESSSVHYGPATVKHRGSVKETLDPMV